MSIVKFKDVNKLEFDRSEVKYIARFSNLDKKYIFKREWINGNIFNSVFKEYIIEIKMNDNTSKYFKIKTDEKEITETTINDIKKELKKDNFEFCIKYFNN